MPVLDGPGLIRKVRSAPELADLPIVTLTSLQADEIRERALATGATAHELKLDKESLAVTIDRIGKEVIARA